MHLTWKQRKALRIAELAAKLELLKLKPWWESIYLGAPIMCEISMISAERQYYDATAKFFSVGDTVDLPSGFDIVITQGESK